MMRKSVPSKIRHAILDIHNGICHYCLDGADEIDHIVSATLGGDDRFENLIASCKSCNRSKRGKPLPEAELRAALAMAAGVAPQLKEMFPGHDGKIYYYARDEIRKPIALPPSLWRSIDEMRKTLPGPIISEAEAVRLLIRDGLATRGIDEQARPHRGKGPPRS